MAVTDKTQIQLDLLSLKKVLSEANKNPKSSQQENKTFYTFSQGISSMNKHLEDNNILLTKMNKSISDLSHGMMMSQKGQAKDLTRKKDPFAKLVKELDDIEKLQRDELKYQKDKDKKSKMGLLGMFGLLLGVGGLLGFLMTGKTEFLHSLIKSFTKYSPLKFFIGILDKGLKAIGAPLIKGVGTLFAKVFDKIIHIPAIQKGIAKVKGVFKPVTEIFTHIGGFFTKIGGIFGKGVVKEGAKIGGKTAGKTLLKRIPFIGSVLGLIFGIQRFKKGDWLGGALEIVSGITSIVPGAGIPLGMAIDAFLLFRDIAGKEKVDKGIGGAVAGAAHKAMDWKGMVHVPGLGVIAGFMQGIDLWKQGKKWDAVQQIATGIVSVVPGAGLILSPILGMIGKWVKGGSETTSAPTDSSMKTAEQTIKQAGKTPPKKGGFMSGVKNVASNTLSGVKNIASGAMDLISDVDVLASAGAGKAVDIGKQAGSTAMSFGSKIITGIKDFLNFGNNVDFSGIDPNFLNRFMAMAQEYYQLTGKKVQVNSGWRSLEKQKELYDEEQKRNPGSTKVSSPYSGRPNIHTLGLALDIQSQQADEMAKLKLADGKTLFQKYNIWQPGLNWRTPEHWHIEPSDINRTNILFGGAKPNVVQDAPLNAVKQVGDGSNMPNVNLQPRVGGAGNKGIDLSESTIVLLAKEIGKQFVASRPIPRTPSFNVSTAGRG